VQGLPEVVGMVILPSGEIKLSFTELLKEAEKIPKGYAPSWSPDGREIAYVSTRNEGNQEIYIRNVSTGAERLVLPSRPGFNINTTSPGWSPDGRWLCFSTFTGGIYIVGTDGKKMYQLTQTGSDFHPAWSPK
jgi:Tol biopolymer transport system component